MMYQILSTIAVFTLLFVCIELAQRSMNISHEITRKIAHITAALGAGLLPYFIERRSIAVVAGFFILAMLVSKHLNIFSSIHKVSRRTYGEVYLPLGVLLLVCLLHDKALFIYAMSVVALGDSAAGLVGGAWGKHKTFNGKSAEGSLAFVTVSAITGLCILALLGSVGLFTAAGISLLIALTAGLVEVLSPNGIDNLTIPLSVALMGSFLL